MQAISAIGIFVSIVFALLLINKKEKSFSNRILIVWMFVFTIHLILPFMMAIGNRFFIEKVNGLDIGFYTLHITFMYYYSLSITNTVSAFKISHLEFLIPTAIVYIVQGFIDRHMYWFSDLVQEHFFSDNKIFHLTGVVSLNLIFCLYFARKVSKILIQHRHNIKNKFSYSEKIDLLWLRNLFFAMVVFTFIIVGYLIALLFGRLNEEWINNYYFSSFSLFAVILGYWGYKQGVIEIEKPLLREEPGLIQDSIQPDSNKKNDVDEEQEDEKIKHLIKIIEEEKPYLDPTLNIGSLANMLNLHSYQLSKYINTCYNKNFFEFINDYRIEEFKKLVANPKNKHYSILGLALDSGFNSKATFNRIFKNSTGQTPSQFRENYKF